MSESPAVFFHSGQSVRPPAPSNWWNHEHPGHSPMVRQSAEGDGPPSPPPGDLLVCAFNALRDELVSTLMFILGNRDDAQDAAQEAFLKCWRSRSGLPDVQNLRAWIFRVGLNAAKDMQRRAWRRRSRPLIGEENMLADHTIAPGQVMEDQEDLLPAPGHYHIAAGGKGSFPPSAERRPDLRADRRGPSQSGRHGQNTDARGPAKAAQGLELTKRCQRSLEKVPDTFFRSFPC